MYIFSFHHPRKKKKTEENKKYINTVLENCVAFFVLVLGDDVQHAIEFFSDIFILSFSSSYSTSNSQIFVLHFLL